MSVAVNTLNSEDLAPVDRGVRPLPAPGASQNRGSRPPAPQRARRQGHPRGEGAVPGQPSPRPCAGTRRLPSWSSRAAGPSRGSPPRAGRRRCPSRTSRRRRRPPALGDLASMRPRDLALKFGFAPGPLASSPLRSARVGDRSTVPLAQLVKVRWRGRRKRVSAFGEMSFD